MVTSGSPRSIYRYNLGCNLKSITAAAKSHQMCLTLCDPIDGGPPGSHPWDSPGKHTGAGCHFLFQCMKVQSESEVAQSCPTLRDPMDCSLPGSSVHGISQARELEWVAIAFSESNAHFSSVQSLSRVRPFATPWIAARQASLSITNSRSSPRFTSIELVMPSSHLILCCPLLLLPPIPPSIRVFSNESTLCMRWPKYWSFSFSVIPSKEIPGLITFKMDWLDHLAVITLTKTHEITSLIAHEYLATFWNICCSWVVFSI